MQYAWWILWMRIHKSVYSDMYTGTPKLNPKLLYLLVTQHLENKNRILRTLEAEILIINIRPR